MKPNKEKFKPAVEKPVLLLLAGALWIVVGTMLLTFSFHWIRASRGNYSLIYVCTGVALALVIHHFGFLRVVDKNLKRILPMKGKKCLFSFMTWKSYVTVVIMIMIGVLLRHSPVPKSYLSILYTGIGLALVLSSLRYLRMLVKQLRKNVLSEE